MHDSLSHTLPFRPEAQTDDELAHYGVPGMRWGKRQAAGSASSSGGDAKQGRIEKKEARKANNEAIRNARATTASRQAKLEAAAIDHSYAQSPEVKKKAEQLMNKYGKELISSPDTEMSQKMTTGEKWAVGIGAGVTVAALAGQVALTIASNRR